MHHPSHPTIHQRNYAFPQTHYNALNKPEDPTPKFITNYKKSTTYTSVITQIPPPQLNQARRYHPSLSPTKSNTNISPKSTLPKIQLIKLSLALIVHRSTRKLERLNCLRNSKQPNHKVINPWRALPTLTTTHYKLNKTETPKIDLQYLTQNKTTVAASTSSDRQSITKTYITLQQARYHQDKLQSHTIPCKLNSQKSGTPLRTKVHNSPKPKPPMSTKPRGTPTIAMHHKSLHATQTSPEHVNRKTAKYLPSTYKVNPHNPSTITEYPGDKYHHSQPKINMKLMKIVDLLPISVLGSHTRKISCTNPQSHQIHVNRYLNSQLRHIPHTKHSSPSYPKPESSVQVQTQTNNPLTTRANPCPNEPLKRNHDCKPKITKNLGSQTPSTSTASESHSAKHVCTAVPKPKSPESASLETRQNTVPHTIPETTIIPKHTRKPNNPKTQITTKLRNLKNYVKYNVKPKQKPPEIARNTAHKPVHTRVYPQTRKHSIFKNRNNKHTTSKSPWLQTP
eukprot:gene3034-2016_t